MKTILIVIAGMGDLPDPSTKRDTPLAEARIPAMDILARRGDMLMINTLSHRHAVSHKNAFLSLLGYDLDRGEPSTHELMEFGLDNSGTITDYPTLKPFVIPGFSGHGRCITTSAWVRGVGKCALLKPTDIYSPGSSDAEILEAIATLTIEAMPDSEFVLVYVDSPLKASLRGDFEGKVAALETIDRHLIMPVADFVWKSELFINMAVATDLVTPWHRRQPTIMNVPAVVYFNNHDREGDPDQSLTEVQAMLTNRALSHHSDLIRYLSNFNVEEEEG